jgi:uncharacterized membrane protein YjgN (DUF898 family)
MLSNLLLMGGYYNGGGGMSGIVVVLLLLVILIAVAVPATVAVVVLYFAFKTGGLDRTKRIIDNACDIKERESKNEYQAKWYEHWIRKFLYGIVRGFNWCTLGFAGAWATTEMRKWVYERTFIEGKQMKYVGQASEFWIKRLIWTLLGIVTCGVYSMLFRPVREEQYFAENLRFVGEEGVPGKFHGGWIDFFLIRVAYYVMTFSVIGYPGAESLLYSFVYANREVGGRKFVFHGSWKSVLARNVFWMLLGMLTVGWWYILAMPAAEHRWITENITPGSANKETKKIEG